ncbi:tRNA uridine(34) 5-carboxymethylaminomethyl modification radical SAM/GNAT enzyme Elp3 [Myxococcota bacterium]|nr:tRNA uridine(34) 5-carboxymethylaminomethyl modification radical SAM/GNAT enzyme Elp3 [Myxococcota bacterium]
MSQTPRPSSSTRASNDAGPRSPGRRQPRSFDPRPHERDLVRIIDEIVSSPELDSAALDRILKRHPRNGKGLFSRSEVIAGFRAFRGHRTWPVEEALFVEKLRLRPVRTLSGVTPVTVLTKPYPCPGTCVFCPSDVRMPKSYLALEPGAQRADDNDFDPYRQTWSRLETYRNIGHPVEKVEMIVLGGTWSFYPEPYRIWFIKRCLEALDDFGRGIDGRASHGSPAPEYRNLEARVEGRAPAETYNQVVGRFLNSRQGGSWLREDERETWESLEAAQIGNESARCRCVGLSVETRPDWISHSEVLRLRRLGVTKVQLGLQSLSDQVLEENRRGHDLTSSRRAMRELRSAGFKIHAHWMPNLLGSTPAADARDFSRLFDSPDFRPDELKVYPCSLVESAELMRFWESGEWHPYEHEELMDLLSHCLEVTPRYCRLTRVIRDFSAEDIVAGNKVANLREAAEKAMKDRGGRGSDIRAREIRGRAVSADTLRLIETRYATSIGHELFLEFVTPSDRIAGFLRLSLPEEPAAIDELRDSALVREVHVYGASLEVGRRSGGASQHIGLGRRLMERAVEHARDAGYRDLAVISSVGTREYYRRLGFVDGTLYQHLTISQNEPAA